MGAGQLGYNIVAMQPYRYMIETNELMHHSSDHVAGDATFYYGLTDHITLISGLVNAVDVTEPFHVNQFGTVGAQLALNGLSVQYNTNMNLNNGHKAPDM